MLPIFEKIKNKARELDIDDGDMKEIFIDTYPIDNEELEKFLKQLNYKYVCETDTNYDSNDRTVIIELEGQPYKLTYYISSYGDGDIVDDVWDWKPAVKKEVITTVYE